MDPSATLIADWSTSEAPLLHNYKVFSVAVVDEDTVIRHQDTIP